MELKGSKTEKNLYEALAGESQARNKYDWFASKAKKDGYEEIAEVFLLLQTTKKNTQNFGSRHFTEAKLMAPMKTFLQPLLVKEANGLICTNAWQKKHAKKDLWNLLTNLMPLQKLKKNTKKDIFV